MTGGHEGEVGGYLADLAQVMARASSGPFVIGRSSDGGHTVTAVEGRRPLATFARRVDAELFALALPDLRAAAAALVETLGLHRDTGTGVCAQDGQEMQCLTRRVVIAQLAPRAAAS